MHTVRLEQFEGPLDLLLRLTEEEKLDITSVSLAAVADQYLEILKQQNLPVEELADFLVVAARLMLIKSRHLLPSLEKDDDETDLETQLKIYKEFHEASKVLHALILKKKYTYVRETPPRIIEPIFHPPEDLTAKHLKAVMIDIIRKIEPFVSLPESVIERTVSIQEKIQTIQASLRQGQSSSLQGLLQTAKTKMEIIVTFIALLELIKQRSAVVTQDQMFGDVMIKPYAES